MILLVSHTGSPHFPYGRRALDAALDQLYGIYRTSAVVWTCQDWEDWDSMATVYKREEQWPQVFYFPHSVYLSSHHLNSGAGIGVFSQSFNL